MALKHMVMKKMKTEAAVRKVELKPVHGILIFIAHIAVFITVSASLQYYLGMIGLMLTEVIILLFAVVPVVLTKNSLKEVFPLKKITLRQFLAVPVFWIASFILNMVFSLVIQFWVTEEVTELARAMSAMFNSVPFVLTFFIVAVMPAVCEEAMHRGLIQYSMHNIKSKWLMVLIMGLIFGIFHLDPVRFIGTAMLGAVLSYIMLETGNFLLPVLLHLFNNAVSVTVSKLSSEMLKSTTDLSLSTGELLSSLGVYLVLSAATPFLFMTGSRLLHTNENNREDNKEVNKEKKTGRLKQTIIAAVITALLFMSGIAVTFVGGLMITARRPVIVMQGGFTADEYEENTFEIDVHEDAVYMMNLHFESQGFLTDIQFITPEGEIVYQNISDTVSERYVPVDLTAGTYRFMLTFIKEQADVEPYLEEKGYISILSDNEKLYYINEVFSNTPNDYNYYMELSIR